MEEVAAIAAEIGRQVARLSRALAASGAVAQPAVHGTLQPPFGNSNLSDWVRSVQLWREHGAALIPGLPDRSCPACGGRERRFLFYSFDAYPYYDCLSCGTWYVPHRVDDELFAEYHKRCPEAYEIYLSFTEQRLGHDVAEADRSRMASYFAEIEPLVDGRLRNYLDVGCAVGHALQVASERGWSATGLDTNQTVIDAGRKRGLRIFRPEEVTLEEGFGLVSLWETLEHLNDPFDVLSSLAPVLHEDGLLSITVPNGLALEAHVMRQDLAWIYGGPGFGTVHINLFRPSSLEHLLNRAGLEVVGWDGEYSSNPNELTSYLAGRHRGAWDYARGATVEQNLPEDVICLLNWIWPAWNTMSRQLLLTPALKVIATRSQSAERKARLKARHDAARRDRIVAELDALYPEA